MRELTFIRAGHLEWRDRPDPVLQYLPTRWCDRSWLAAATVTPCRSTGRSPARCRLG
jgi:hypothetical protein